jgi:hypothetical protein
VLSNNWALVLIRLANDASASSTVCSGQTIGEDCNQYTKICQQHTHLVRESTTTKLFACLVMEA